MTGLILNSSPFLPLNRLPWCFLCHSCRWLYLTSPLFPKPQVLILSPPSSLFSPPSAPSPWLLHVGAPLTLFPIYTPLLGDFIQPQGFGHHLIVGDFQVYISFPDFSLELWTCVSNCFLDLCTCMSKSGFLNFGTIDIFGWYSPLSWGLFWTL